MTYRILPFSQLDTDTLYELLAHRQEVFVLEQGNIYPDLEIGRASCRERV